MNPLEALIQQLMQQAGPRGATFAGRAMQPRESLQQALGRFPIGEAEYGGIAMQSPQLLQQLLMPMMAGTLRLPPWLIKHLPGRFQEQPDYISRRIAEALSYDPLNPVQALKANLKPRTEYLTDEELMATLFTPGIRPKQNLPKPYTDTEIAAMVMAHSIQGGVKLRPGLTYGQALEYERLDRLLLPEKLQELKKWALDTLQKAAQEKSPSFPPTPLPPMPGRPINPQTTILEGNPKELQDQLLELLQRRR